MERAEWLLLMNIKCKLLAMAGGFTGAISQELFPEDLFPNFCTSTVYATPRDVGRSELSRSPLVGRVASLSADCAPTSSNPVCGPPNKAAQSKHSIEDRLEPAAVHRWSTPSPSYN